MSIRYIVISILFFFNAAFAQRKAYNASSAGNPILPGYFADPTVKKFGDTWYIYATTDGNGGGFGPSQVWKSKDFVNWSLEDMNWPTTHHYWAPDVTRGNDGKYYMYYCQPVEIFGASGISPTGPWTSLLPPGQPIIRNYFVPDVITLDGQTFRDDDGKFYMFWGTWGIYPNSGCGVGLLNTDMKSFAKTDKIPNTVAKDFFEAPFMFKRNGIYYLTYSSERCEDASYKVRYVMSRTGPMGPFVEGKNNPILVTNADGTVHGPGHQSVLQEGKDFYLIYHRHNNPHNNGGYHRQVAADKIEFDKDGNIKTIEPTHEGIGYLGKNENPHQDLALGKNVEVSSFYSSDFKPEYAVDNNNGTLWKPKNNTSDAWLSIDLGAVKNVKSVHTQFEYATWYYQYLIESSVNGSDWKVFADRSENRIHGSPMVDLGNVSARYVRLRILNTEYPGLNKAIWNIRVFDNASYKPVANTVPGKPVEKRQAKGLLVDLSAAELPLGSVVSAWRNSGVLKGEFEPETDKKPIVNIIEGRKALIFSGATSLRSNLVAPPSLSGNSSFSVSMWLYNPEVQTEEPVITWTERGGVDITNATFGYGSHKQWGAAAHWGWPDMSFKKVPEAGKWHHIAFTFDGTHERIYVDGQLDKQDMKMLFLANLRNFVIGTTSDKNAYFSGAISSLKVYDIALSGDEVKQQANEKNSSNVAVYLDAAQLPYGTLKQWKNEGFESGVLTADTDYPAVRDFEGKIALKFGGSGFLSAGKLQESLTGKQPYTLVAVVNNKGKKDSPVISWSAPHGRSLVLSLPSRFNDGKWHQLVCTFDGKDHQVYVDGTQAVEPVPAKDSSGQTAFSLRLGMEGFKGAISTLIVYSENIGLAGIKELYTNWRQTFPKATPARISFKSKPEALTPEMVMLEAGEHGLSGERVEYSFIGKRKGDSPVEEQWREAPRFVDYGKKANSIYSYTVKARDNYGNVTLPSEGVLVNTNESAFRSTSNLFSENADLLKVNVATKGWDGLQGKATRAEISGNQLTLESINSFWDGNEPQGPFLYKEIKGDFVAEVEVADVIGFAEKKANGANECGIMVLSKDNKGNLIQSGIMPGWGVGNIITELGREGRKQTNNQAGWKYFRFLQIQRTGDLYYLRGSEDGISWHALTAAAIKKDLGPTVQLGLYHATYGKNSGWAKFRNYRIVQRTN